MNKLPDFSSRVQQQFTRLAVFAVFVSGLISISLTILHLYESVSSKMQQQSALVSYIMDSTIREGKLYLRSLSAEDSSFITRIENMDHLGTCPFLEEKKYGLFDKLIVVKIENNQLPLTVNGIGSSVVSDVQLLTDLITQIKPYILNAYYGNGSGSIYFPVTGEPQYSELEGNLYIYTRIISNTTKLPTNYVVIGEIRTDGSDNLLYSSIKKIFEDKLLIFPSMRTIHSGGEIVPFYFWETISAVQFCSVTKGTQLGYCLRIELAEEVYNIMIQVIFLLIVLILFILLSLLASRKIVADLTQPINTLISGVREMEKGIFGGTKIHLGWNGQLGYLAESFNTLSTKLKDNTEDLIDVIRSEKASHALLEAVLETTNDPIMIIKEGCIVYASSSMVQLFTELPVDVYISATINGKPRCQVLDGTEDELTAGFLETGEIRTIQLLEQLATGIKPGIQKYADKWFDVHIHLISVGVPTAATVTSYFDRIGRLLNNLEYKEYRLFLFKDITDIYMQKLKAELYAHALQESAKIREELEQMKNNAIKKILPPTPYNSG